MTTTESNKLIAEFMEIVFHDDENQYYNVNGLYIGSELQFHTSWDWLMPVVDKIGNKYHNITCEYDEGEPSCAIAYYNKEGALAESFTGSGNKLSTATYQAIVKFIKYYNLNQ